MEWKGPSDAAESILSFDVFDAGGVAGHEERRDTYSGDDEGFLLVRGVVLGVVASCTTTLNPEISAENSSLCCWMMDVIQHARNLAPKKDLPQSLSQVLFAGMHHLGLRFAPVSLRKYTQTMVDEGESESSEDFALKGPRVISAYQRFFTCGSSYIGLGPQLTESGDVVVILRGSKMPLMFRPDGEQYRLLGQCYIKDVEIMFGVFMEQHLAEGKPLEEFVPR